MKEYLKMADVFVGDYHHSIRMETFPPHRYGECFINLHGISAKYAAHAINSHDELVAENERLVSVLWEVDRVLSEIQKNGVFVYGLDDLIDEVNHSIQSPV